MDQTLYFYDLETTGINPREDRIMQFAGQRTDIHLKPIGKPDNFLVKLGDDVLPDPQAILVTGITPQKTLEEGYTEAEFLQLFHEKIVLPNTIFVGYNSIRFDDEFMRYSMWRNYYDPYEWQWKQGCSRWDLLDVVRMTRALRPDGIQWPTNNDGIAINKLEPLTEANNISHDNAHDALSDVYATIDVARLLKNKQTKLFNYLLSIRDKKSVNQVIHQNDMFVHTSGRLNVQYQKTSVFTYLFDHPDQPGTSITYDLRHNPVELANKSVAELVVILSDPREHGLVVKSVKHNRSPAVAPVGVLSIDNQDQLQLDLQQLSKHLKQLRGNQQLILKLKEATAEIHKNRLQQFSLEPTIAEAQLYDGFIAEGDKTKASVVRAANSEDLATMSNEFSDVRLRDMFTRYKARNYPHALSDNERIQWEQFRYDYLVSGGEESRLNTFAKRMQDVTQQKTAADDYILQELQLYVESIIPLEP